jgi:hypothetical protein
LALVFIAPSGPPHKMTDEAYEEQDQKNHKQDFGNACRRSGNASEPKDTCNDRDDQEY